MKIFSNNLLFNKETKFILKKLVFIQKPIFANLNKPYSSHFSGCKNISTTFSNFFARINNVNKENKVNNIISFRVSHFCILKQTDLGKVKKVEKVKKKFNNNEHKVSSKLMLLEKNIVADLDMNISQDIKRELDQGIKITTELEKENLPVSKVDAYYYMKSIDSKFESFFHNREFNIKNFNYYLQVLASQHKTNDMESTLEKMQEMGINPNVASFIILMNSYAKAKNIDDCERIFEIIKKRTNNKVTIFTYNTLLLAYSKNGLINQAEAIMNEMKNKGLEPDSACYTTLIHAYKKAKSYDKCWELYNDCLFYGKVDEFLISYMIKLAGFTHDPEKALKLYEYFELEGFNHYTINFNSLLFALSSTKRYAEKALEVFQKMKMKKVLPDSYTYVCVLRATAHLGDINTANEVLKEMKLMDIPINEYICNGLIRTYSGAARIPYVKLEHLEEYLKDAWNIFYFMEKNNLPIKVQILDSLLEIYCVMHKKEDIDGLILPLYEKFGYEYTPFTYEYLTRMMLDLRDYDRLIRIYTKLNKEKDIKNKLTDKILNCCIETGMRTNDCDLIVSALENFVPINKMPSYTLLKKLANIENLPDSLFVELKNWIDTDKFSRKFRVFSPAQIRERSRSLPDKFRNRGKRIK